MAQSSTRTWILTAFALLLAWIVLLAIFGLRTPSGGNLDSPRLNGVLSEQAADFSWVLRDLDDSPVELSKYRGKAIFLNLWATWCPPCVAEMPSIARLAANPRLKDVAFLCVSTDESPKEVRNFIQGKDWPMTILRATSVPDVFATDGIPTTIMIAPSGQIMSMEVGSAQWDDPSVIDYLEKLAKSSNSPKEKPQETSSVKP